jgi:hypothetical protein
VSDPLSREQILVPVLAYEDIEVPAWGRTVRVREMTVRERTAFEISVYRSKATGMELRSELVVRTCTDPATGERLFPDGDAPMLAATSAKVLQPLYLAALRLSGLTDEEAQDLGKAAGAGSGSSSSSPSASG